MNPGAKTTARGFEPYIQDVYGWAYRLLGRHHDALDVVQDVYLRWSEQCTTSAPRQPRGWLRRVTWNRAIDAIRRRQRRDRDASLDSRASGAQVEAAVEPLDREVLRSDIGDALERLSNAQRSVLVAKVYDEMSFAQIAGEMEISVSTVKTHYMRALRVMRERLGSRWLDEDRS